MTTQAEVLRGGVQPSTTSARLVRFLARTPVHVGLIVIALLWLIPTIGLGITSFRPRSDILGSGWWTANSFTFDNYHDVLVGNKMGESFLNSLFISIPATLIPLLVGALAAFAFSWIPFPFRDTIFLIVIALMVVPIQTTFVPDLKLFRSLGLANSFGGIWLAHATFALPFCIFLLRNFFITLPRDLIEAAKVDGASNMRIFFRVVLPLSVPALASFGIFQFLWVWNDLLNALIFLPNSELWPMTVRISQLQTTYGVEWHLLSSAAFMLMIVPLVVFFSLQRYFVQGLLAGSVK